MPSAERVFDRSTRQGQRQLRLTGDEFRERRLFLGLSQAFVAGAARMSRPRYVWIEAGRISSLTILEFNRIAGVLGLDTSVRLYPGGSGLRDKGQIGRIRRLLEHVRSPLSFRTEVPLPPSAGGIEQRAWDVVLFATAERTAVEVEMRLRDLQALDRRISLKRRDDPSEHFLLAIADTRNNRQILGDIGWSIAGLARLRTVDVLKALEAGRHPATGFVLI